MAELGRAVTALVVFLLRVRPQMDGELTLRSEFLRTKAAVELEGIRVYSEMALQASSRVVVLGTIIALVDRLLAAVASFVVG